MPVWWGGWLCGLGYVGTAVGYRQRCKGLRGEAERDDREERQSGLGVFICVRSLKLACGMPF